MPTHVTVEEYLGLERESPIKHELVGGVMYAMAGASARHTMLALAVASTVRSAAIADGCRTYMAEMKVRVGDAFYYPDVMVACEELPDEYFETAPCLLVEVLSPSTAGVDRREKVGAYTGIPELQAYLIVDPAGPGVVVHQRLAGRWTSRAYGAGESITLACPPVTLPIDELYEGLPPLAS